MLPEHKNWLQDVTRVWIQGHEFQCDVYVKPANQFNQRQDIYLKLLKSFYELCEAG